MEYGVLHSSVISILSAVITGGFVLVFVEISNRKNRENDRYRQIMEPFMFKLSAYCRYMSWCVSHIQYPSQSKFTEHEKNFYDQTHRLSAMGGRLIVAGGNYQYDDFTAKDLQRLCEQINDVWYQYDHMGTKRITWNHLVPNQDYINKEIAVINPQWLSLKDGIEKIVKISGDFYTDIYRSVEEETFRHDLIRKIYRWHSVFILSALFFVLVSLCLMLCIPISAIILRIITIFVIVLFGVSLFTIFVDEQRQIEIAVKFRNFLQNKHKCDMKINIRHWLEPIGLAFLLVAFVWQQYSAYQTQLVYNTKIYKMENTLDYILQCECDEAMRDPARYKGEAIVKVPYDLIHAYEESYFEDTVNICALKDKASYAWRIQCVLYLLGGICVVWGKVCEAKALQEEGKAILEQAKKEVEQMIIEK